MAQLWRNNQIRSTGDERDAELLCGGAAEQVVSKLWRHRERHEQCRLFTRIIIVAQPTTRSSNFRSAKERFGNRETGQREFSQSGQPQTHTDRRKVHR